MKTQRFRHVTPHNGRWTYQLSILGSPCRTNTHFDSAEDAGIACDLVKHYLRTEYKLDLPPSLDGEQFSSLAYSRRGVDLSDSFSVFRSISGDVQEFLTRHKPELEAYRDSQPAPSVSSKFRNSGLFSDARIKEWFERCEAAEAEAKSFSTVNSDYLFRLIDALSGRLIDAVKPLKLALKMHDGVTGHKILARKQAIQDLITHLESDIEYAIQFAAGLRVQDSEIKAAAATLEANRPNIS